MNQGRVYKAYLVLRYEISSTARTKSFMLVTFGLPLMAALIFLIVSLLGRNTTTTSSQVLPSTAEGSLQVEGFVDPGGLVQALGPEVPDGILIPYRDEAAARQALQAGHIAAYYIVPADYLVSGDLIYVNPRYTPRSGDGQSWVMRHTIFANLLGNNRERLSRASIPMEVYATALAPQALTPDDHPAAFYIPYGVMLMLYLFILMSASLLLNGVSNEKKNRVMEILLLSVSPRQLLFGKVAALGLLGLLQTAIWLGLGFGLLRIGGSTLSLPAGLELPASILAWGVAFFLLGYAVYASLMAGLGALVPNLREASQAVIIVIWPMIIPIFFLPVLIEKSHGALATILSLFPLTAPIAMMARLAVGGVPVWQPILAAALLAFAGILATRTASAMFRAQNLLSGQSFSLRRFLGELSGRRSG